MIILGIDPGYAIVGYGVIDTDGMRPISYGAIRTEAGIPIEDRLSEIYDNMTELLRTFRPDHVAIEKLYFNTNEKTAINVSQARGVIVLACVKCGVKVHEYTPLQVKMSVVGYGRAEKGQIMDMTKRLLGLKKTPRPDDAADALAIALCHANTTGSLLMNL
ncbi:MAG: crossover junction endodeoxyribonuclease RuvC [Oscillospiraceae bacterium]|nr:crossover junction endodeoxyribonuclease RuvC [Oscillospiraceae bacterium]MBQ2741636.1 crossover junction endodeoxyribonuclease RuvC [Oscillospiraceae bacterium]MBQ3224554.1 crossover junction endodeoxyribonuclease RuvC [Oscillospiraceae bacterium]MBQ4315817.1 crossover junction endodeoxyribonuclease RuvC [Oscillospiraceae bacterium]MBQ6698684.1 crossover junction endodeoxyribonuclease RuvC [Oscillospiraceae bacterium]